MRHLLLALAAVGIVVGAATPGRTADAPAPTATTTSAAKRPNILLVTLDTTRADHTSAYGYSRPTTPRLAELAQQGVRFASAYAPMATTLPSHTSMFTGLLPRTHGALKNGLPIDPKLRLLSETLGSAGYKTAAFLGSFAVAGRFGLQRGFAEYDDRFQDGQCKWDVTRWEGQDVEGEFCRRGDLTRAATVKWLESTGYLPPAKDEKTATGTPKSTDAKPQQPFFVWIHFFDPHNPYDPPAEQAKLFPPLSANPSELERDIAHYDAEIHFADQEMGKLVDALAAGGVLDDTLVIVAGDHGEGLMDHGWMLHGLQIYEEAVHVPLVFRWPARLPKGTTLAEPVELIDLTPTILELTGVPVPQGKPTIEGISLAAALTGKGKLDPERPILLQRRHYARGKEKEVVVKGPKHALRVGDWKYIAAPEEGTYELYDLKSDPREKKNLADVKTAERDAMAARLDKTLAAIPVAPKAARTVSEEDARKLEALGYVQ
jgi:arylsulfatase A-like enzyme